MAREQGLRADTCDVVTAAVPSSRSISRRHLVINVGDVNEEDGV